MTAGRRRPASRRLPTVHSDLGLDVAERTVARRGCPLSSSSGWEHRFRYEMPHVVYVHSPAPWLFAADDHRLRLSRVRQAGLAAGTPLLCRGDREAMARASAMAASAAVTHSAFRDAYRLDLIVVQPPVAGRSHSRCSACCPGGVRCVHCAQSRLQETSSSPSRAIYEGGANLASPRYTEGITANISRRCPLT